MPARYRSRKAKRRKVHPNSLNNLQQYKNRNRDSADDDDVDQKQQTTDSQPVLFQGSIETNVSDVRPTLRKDTQHNETNEIVNLQTLNWILDHSQKRLLEHIKYHPNCHAATIRIRCETKRNAPGRYLQAFCSCCGQTIKETISHKVIKLNCDGHEYAVSTLDAGWVIGCNELSVKNQGLNTLSCCLNLPVMTNKVFDKLVIFNIP